MLHSSNPENFKESLMFYLVYMIMSVSVTGFRYIYGVKCERGVNDRIMRNSYRPKHVFLTEH